LPRFAKFGKSVGFTLGFSSQNFKNKFLKSWTCTREY
jgi:hypothetical protein